MKPRWHTAGLSEAAAEKAEEALPRVLELIDRYGFAAVHYAFYEADFIRNELPTRTPAFRRKYKKENE